MREGGGGGGGVLTERTGGGYQLFQGNSFKKDTKGSSRIT